MLNYIEEQRLKVLTNNSVEFSLIEPTATGLKKSILDATFLVRKHLKNTLLHDYSQQKQGEKSTIKSYLLNEKSLIESKASLYRPKTKKGDPRIWFKNLTKYAKPNDILAIIVFSDELYIINITQIDVESIVRDKITGPILDLINEFNSKSIFIAMELLDKLRIIARSGYVKSIMPDRADTSIGRTLESLLGVAINSSQNPDYKGIELKSYRFKKKGSSTRHNLFAKVPNWQLSKFKSSREILENFGYSRSDEFKLYCTVSTKKRNAQGLCLVLDFEDDQLFENSDKLEIGNFVLWLMEDLRRKLLEKHNETFWVEAKSKIDAGEEYFQFTKVTHTRKPIKTQFDLLLSQGYITVDHLIKRNKTGKVSEKGPLFKINPAALELLFPPSKHYDLLVSK